LNSKPFFESVQENRKIVEDSFEIGKRVSKIEKNRARLFFYVTSLAQNLG
jgi:hypothetical protein